MKGYTNKQLARHLFADSYDCWDSCAGSSDDRPFVKGVRKPPYGERVTLPVPTQMGWADSTVQDFVDPGDFPRLLEILESLPRGSVVVRPGVGEYVKRARWAWRDTGY